MAVQACLARTSAVRDLARSWPRHQMDAHVWKIVHAGVDEMQAKAERQKHFCLRTDEHDAQE